MKFKIDENLPAEFAPILREPGLLADSVGDERLSGSADETLIDHCRAEGRLLVTLDLEFANLQAYPPKSHPGNVVMRSKVQDKVTLIEILKRLVPELKRLSPVGQLWVVEADRIRIRE